MQDFHQLPPDAPPAWRSYAKHAEDHAPGLFAARGERLRRSRIIRLKNGLKRTKQNPTPMPAMPKQSTLLFHPAAGR
jgi:hypothetical protein